MSSAKSESPAGSPSTIAVRRGPCDSPAVIQRRRDMREVTYTKGPGASLPCYFLRGMRRLAPFAPFEKYEGLGNDFIVVDVANEDDVTVEQARALCDRRRGIG